MNVEEINDMSITRLPDPETLYDLGFRRDMSGVWLYHKPIGPESWGLRFVVEMNAPRLVAGVYDYATGDAYDWRHASPGIRRILQDALFERLAMFEKRGLVLQGVCGI
ncbi:hypothetical protein [Bifidobacterium sp. SO1]|uniref:hypothetical protein n=1 Tax=Bifidobacterium sp. SO1 TaxID=2809029 RepID=UPI001BDD9CEF|nr:hypothetical protein [Bifidobacterium sp. SO1]MBT1161702.1 hypothetical protein [Bifidobacterium sp. SO1]